MLIKPKSGRFVFSVDSEHHPIEVRENKRFRWMHFLDEKIQSLMSLSKPEQLILDYLPVFLGSLVLHPEPKKIGLLGLGGGSMVRYLHRYFNECELTVLEINPKVIEVAKRYFQLPNNWNSLKLIEQAGERFLAQTQELSDILFIDIDTPNNQPDILSNRNFYQLCHDRLSQEGILSINLACARKIELRRLLLLLKSIFQKTPIVFPIENYQNTVIHIGKSPYWKEKIIGSLSQKKTLTMRWDLDYGFVGRGFFDLP